MDIKPVKVAVAICLKGHTPPKSYHDRMLMAFSMGNKEMEQRLHGTAPLYEFNWFTAGEIFVPYARDTLAKASLDHGCDYLFMVDDDMLAPFDLFYQLVKHDKDIVAPLAFTRNPPHNPVAYFIDEGWDPAMKSQYIKNIPIMNYPRDSLFRCDAVGFGAVLIKSSVLKGIQAPRFMSTSPTGEDILFCYKAREQGFQVWMDSSIKLGHLSDSLVVTEEYRDQFAKMGPKDWENKYGKYTTYPTLEATR